MGFNSGLGTFTYETCALRSRGHAALFVIPELHVHVFFNALDLTFYFKNNNSKEGMMWLLVRVGLTPLFKNTGIPKLKSQIG